MLSVSSRGRVSQVIAYCLLPCEKVRGHGDHIYFFPPARPPAPFFSRHTEEQRGRGAGRRGMGRVWLEGESAAADEGVWN